MDSERTYSMSEIREKRRTTEQLLALQQRRLDALAKIDEGTAELEQVEREMEALARGETQPEQADATLHSEPQGIGERALTILKDQADTWLAVRDVLAGMESRRWMDADTEHVMQRLRHCLPRLVRSNEHVQCNKDGTRYFYKYVSRLDSDLLVAVPQANGAPYPALQGGYSDS